ncbi:peptidase M56 [Clostridiaceae bacterium UIB06]|uniref:Peptidase M56 n=1 Tax=Clostridium thailandense TaxID=2794346 RepID=A0A949U011_9CLOT|nr:M56 family metallopeptidase [Clostridium thailandense]MBV7274810.1 peptidase M56 [Clostridium thailandense]MCH5137271.1 peptidase M56 [Clostridiaceae bacterium UIB06]
MLRLFFYNYILFNWIVQLSVAASILVVLIIIIRNLHRNIFGAKFQYIIWFVVVLRLIVPQLPTSSISIFNYIPKVNQMPPIIVANKNIQNTRIISTGARVNSAYGVYDDKDTFRGAGLTSFSYIAKTTPLDQSINFIFSLIWIIGVLGISIYKMSIYIHFHNKIKKGYYMCDGEISNVLENCKNKMNITGNIKLVQTERVISPSLIGFIRPIILLPKNIEEIVPIDKLNYIFIHELAHLKRGDVVTNWIILILRTLHWFNPTIQYGLVKMCEDMEISCDSLALSYINDDETKAYGLTILTLAEKLSTHTRLPGMASLVSNKSKMKRRIIMIKLFNKKSYKLSAMAMATILVLGCSVLTDAKASSIKKQIASKISMHQDKIDYPFVNDDQIIGRWQSVDFVNEINDFKVDSKSFKGNLYVRELNVLQDGKVSKTAFTWTKGLFLNESDKTASKYVIKEIEGSTYMFFEWKSGDYTLWGRKPSYYVMKKISSTPSLTINMLGKEVGNTRIDKVDYSFIDDSQVIGKWKSVDFVKNANDFRPGIQSWQTDLFVDNLNFSKGGNVSLCVAKDGETYNVNLTWTKDLVIDKNNKTASKYIIKEINGSTYMFYEWKSGDYTEAGMQPWYYVLEKTD